MNFLIRAETAADVAAIHAVIKAAFLDAPHTSHVEQFIVDTLRAAGMLSISLVAEIDGVVVGHAAVSPVSISDGSPGWFGFGPISVAPDYQRRGIGSDLMRETLRLLRQRDASGCVLVGEPDFYSRFGFKPEEALILPYVPSEYFQAVSFDNVFPRGIVTFHPAFSVRS